MCIITQHTQCNLKSDDRDSSESQRPASI
jgi:hypothetical protein